MLTVVRDYLRQRAPQGLLVLAVGGALASGGGRLIQLGYPLAVLLVGMWLHRVSQPRYISFVLWV